MNYGHSVAICDLQCVLKSYEKDVENAKYQLTVATRVVRERQSDLDNFVAVADGLKRSIELLEAVQRAQEASAE